VPAHPPRLAHLLTRAELVRRLAPTYAAAHELEYDEAAEIVDRALRGRLREELLDAIWAALQPGKVSRSDEFLLERVARALTDRPRLGRVAAVTPTLGAILIRLDLEAGVAGESARRVLETEQGREASKKGLVELGAFVARDVTRK
jgi:hypothetical protein